MRKPVLELFFLGSREVPIRVHLEGRPLAFSPLERALFGLLARTDRPVEREVIQAALAVSRASLHKLVYTTRRKLGAHRNRLQQLGRATARRGKTLGFSGYQLVELEIRWLELGSAAS